MGSLVAAANAIGHRASVNGPELGMALAGRALGIGGAFGVLGFIDDRDTFSLLIAIVILFAIVLSLVNMAPRKTPRSIFVAGIVSGVTGTITSVGAPPMGVVYQHSRRRETSATLNAYFAIGGLVSAIVVCLVLVLKSQFFEPLAQAMERREEQRAAARSEHAEAERRADEASERTEAALAQARKAGYAEMDRVRREASARAEDVLQRSRAAADETVAAGRRRLREQSERAAAEMEARAGEFGAELSARLLRKAS